MKKNYKTKRVIRLLITLMLMATLLLSCSSTEAETETAEAKPEVEDTTTERVEVEVEEEAPAEESKPEETESTEVEAEAEATEEESAEAEEEASVEESAEPQISEEPVEEISLAEYNTVSNYISTLDPEKPAIIIVNPDEGYVINMQEGQHYQLKSTDKIILNSPTATNYGWDFNVAPRYEEWGDYCVFDIDYSKMQLNHKWFLKKRLDNGEIIQLTCYLDPPAE